MKLLFLLDEVYAPNGPTVRFGRELARRLARFGCQVSILENVPQNAPLAPYTDDGGVRRLPFCDTTERALYQLVAGWRGRGVGLPGMALRALGHPRQLATLFSLLALKRSPLEGAFRRRLHALCAKEPFDAVISVSAPHYTAFALAGSSDGYLKAAYMVDPYASAAVMRGVSSARREHALYRALDRAFITDLMAERRLYPPEFAAKTVPLHFPAIRKPEIVPAPDDIRFNSLEGTDKDTINCVFVGNLYLDIRDPSFALALFERLPRRFVLWLVGDGFGQFPPSWRKKWQSALGSRLQVRPPVSQAAAWNAMQNADVLVSLGNADATQLPSKVFDYISAGRPVLNLYELENCPTLPFFARCPLALSLRKGGAPTESQVAQAAAFMARHAGQRVPFEEIEPAWRDYTAGAVAEKMLATLRQATHSKEGGA